MFQIHDLREKKRKVTFRMGENKKKIGIKESSEKHMC